MRMSCSSKLMITVCDRLGKITELKMNTKRANRFLAEAAMLFTGRCLHSGRGTQTPILFVITQGEKNHMANLAWDHRQQLSANAAQVIIKASSRTADATNMLLSHKHINTLHKQKRKQKQPVMQHAAVICQVRLCVFSHFSQSKVTRQKT